MIFLFRGLGAILLVLIGIGGLAMAAHSHDTGVTVFAFGLVGFALIMLFRLIALIDFDSQEKTPS